MLSIETIHQPDSHRVVIARDASPQYVGIIAVQDFVANAGGVIAASVELLRWSKSRVIARIDQVADDVLTLCREASRARMIPLTTVRMRIQGRRTLTSPSG